jgi:hypothetical protein
MANVVEIILKATDQASATLKKSSGELGKMQSSLMSMVSPVTLVSAGIAGVGAVIASSIKDVSEYNRTVMLLSQNLSLTSEETSRIIQVADDFGISIDQVRTSLQFAAKNGFAPTVENLANLADHLKTVQDPTVRAAELTKIFGRSWSELTPLLNAGGDAIRNGSAAIEDGLIVTQAAIDQSERLRIANDRVSDSFTSIKNSIGNTATPALADITSKAADYFQMVSLYNKASREGVIVDDKAIRVTMRHADATMSYTEVIQELTDLLVAKKKITDANDQADESRFTITNRLTDATYEQNRVNDIAADRWQGLGEKMQFAKEEAQKLANEGLKQLQYAMAGKLDDAAKGFTERVGELGTKTRILEDKISELEKRKYLTGAQKQELADLKKELEEVEKSRQAEKTTFDDTSARILFDLMQERLAVDGVIDQEDLNALTNYATKTGLVGEAATAASLLMQQAWIDAKGDASLYGQKVLEIIGFIKSIPTDVNVDLWIKIHQGVVGGNLAPPGPPPGPGYTWDGTRWVKNKAAGGPVMAGGAYIVGEAGPEMFVPSTSGKIIPNNQMGAGINLTINAYGLDENALAQAVVMKLNSMARLNKSSGRAYAGRA